MKKYTLDDILENQETFEKCLHGSWIIFPRESENFKYSGYVTAALLNGFYAEEGTLGIKGFNGWNTFHFTTKEELKTFLSCKPDICLPGAASDNDCYTLE